MDNELDEYSMFLERLTRPPFRDMMSNQNVADRDLVPRTFNRPIILRKPLQLLTNILCDQSRTVRPSSHFEPMIHTHCRIPELSQKILYVRSGDPEEVSQSGSIVGLEVLRNLLEEIGKGDRHDRSRARDIVHRQRKPGW